MIQVRPAAGYWPLVAQTVPRVTRNQTRSDDPSTVFTNVGAGTVAAQKSNTFTRDAWLHFAYPQDIIAPTYDPGLTNGQIPQLIELYLGWALGYTAGLFAGPGATTGTINAVVNLTLMVTDWNPATLTWNNAPAAAGDGFVLTYDFAWATEPPHQASAGSLTGCGARITPTRLEGVYGIHATMTNSIVSPSSEVGFTFSASPTI